MRRRGDVASVNYASVHCAQAPVRISFGGGGSDLPAYYESFGGFVISATIDRYCRVRIRETGDGAVRLESSDYGISQVFPGGEIPSLSEPLSLLKAALIASGDAIYSTGVEVRTSSEVPPGTGLGSSSAMAVALTSVLASFGGDELAPEDVALAACRLEIERLNMPIGKQDQYASAYGGLNTITFSADDVCVRPLDVSLAARTELADRLLLFATGKTRHSSEILGRQSKDTRDRPAVTNSLHALKDLAFEMEETLEAENLDAFGELLHRAWEYKKRLSDHITNHSIDTWYQAGLRAGALGGKITGAGGGGFLLLYCPRERMAPVRESMGSFGLRELTFGFDQQGVTVSNREERMEPNIVLTGRGETEMSVWQRALARLRSMIRGSSVVVRAEEGREHA